MLSKTRKQQKAARKKKKGSLPSGENVTYISGLRLGTWLVDINWVKERISSTRSISQEAVSLEDVLDWFNTEGHSMRNATVFGFDGFLMQIRDGKVVTPPKELSITEIRNGKAVATFNPPVIKVEGLHKSNSSSPPLIGQFILEILLSRKEADNLIGDLAEDYNEKAIKYGIPKAKIWFWKQVIGSIWPLARRVVPWGVFAWLVEWFRRHL
jgi:hypothetical protein